MRNLLVAALLVVAVGCAAEPVTESESAVTNPARTQAMIACIELCVDDSLACYQIDPGDCNARCVDDLAGIPGFCMALARDWYQCVRGLYPFCVDGHSVRWGCYDEYSEYADCFL